MIIDFERIKHNYSSITPGDVVVLKFQASCEIGLGHLSRMLTLAGMLKNSNKAVICAVNNNDTVIKKLADRGLHYEVNQFSKQEHFIDYMLEKYKPNAIVIDEKYHYSAKDITRWQKISQLICIDNIKKDYKNCYKIIMPNNHFQVEKNLEFENVVWGFDYVLFSDEIFRLQPKTLLPKKIKKIVVTTGGADPKGVLFYLIEWLKNCDKEVLALYGESFKYKLKLSEIGYPKNFKILPYNPKLLLEADSAVSTFGVSIYELIYLNIPIICVGHTKENAESGQVLAKRCKLVRFCDYYENIGRVNCHRILKEVENEP